MPAVPAARRSSHSPTGTDSRVASGIGFDFAISRQDVAEMSGTTLHTVSRTLSAWEEQGLVEGGRQKITIREPDALLAIAEDQPTPTR
jgi:CRP/FNR family transcriptional regulator, nitrogen oxide reductase regulator